MSAWVERILAFQFNKLGFMRKILALNVSKLSIIMACEPEQN